MKILNIDELAAAKRTITLGGVNHPVNEMSVENFIETTKEAEALEAAGKTSFSDKIEATISLIHRSVPTVEVKQLRALTLEQLVMVSRFLRGELDSEQEEGEAGKQ